MRKICMLLFLLGANILSAQVDTLFLSNGTFSPKEVIIDTDSRLSINDLQDSINTGLNFQNPENLEFSGSNAYWLKFIIANDEGVDQKWILSFANTWEILDFYLRESDDWDIRRTGSKFPTAKKDYPLRGRNLIPIDLKRDQTLHCIVRLAVPTQSHLPTNFKIQADERNAYETKELRWRAILNIFVGIFLVMFFYHLMIYFTTKDSNYLYYLLFLACRSFVTEMNFGYHLDHMSFFEPYQYWHPIPIRILGSLSNISFILFTLQILTVREIWPKWDKIFKVLIGLLAIIPIFVLLGYNNINLRLLFALQLTTLLLIFFISIKSYLRKVPASGYFLIGQVPLMILLVPTALIALGVLKMNDLLLLCTPIGFTLEMILFSFALAARINWLKEENEKKQEQIIIAERKNAYLEKDRAEKLAAADKLKDQFLANTSHELRTPLHGIIGLSEALYDSAGKSDAKSQKENLSMIISSGKRLSNLVDDILDISKLKNAGIELRLKPVSLYSLVDIVLKTNSTLVKGKSNLRLINDVPSDLPLLHADENRLQQILFNLIGNAVKFTTEGHIKVSAFAKGGMVQVTVEDTGVGIPESKHEAVFREFEQGDGSSIREFSGTGLGLTISRKLVELHGGKIWLESKEGIGSKFMFTIPHTDEVIDDSAVEDITETVMRPLQTAQEVEERNHEEAVVLTEKNDFSDKIRILVVDDEPINQQVLKNHLIDSDYQIFQALNGAEALEMIMKEDKFDLVLLDLMMPKMSGYEVCEQIREKYLPSELPIIMVTAKNQVQDLVQGLELGANDYLSKPFTKAEFLARVRTHLNLHRVNQITSKFVPNEFINSLGRANISEVLLGDHIEKEVTVFFSDIRSYTSLSEQMTPEQNFKFVKNYNSIMGPIIHSHKGFINQYLGDGIMAIFPRSPEDSLRAAIDMQVGIRDFNEKRSKRGRLKIKVGMGMHTGPLILGIIGDANRLDATTISDSVNTASRIESLTKHYGSSILLSDASLQKIENKDDFHFRHLGKVKVKGKIESVDLYECLDGDPDELRNRKLDTITGFEKGLSLFLNKEFESAAQTFLEIFEYNPDDHVAKIYYDKSKNLIGQELPPDWTGIESVFV